MSGKVYLVDDFLMQRLGIGLGPDIEGEIVREAGFTYIKENCETEDEIIERCADADIIFNCNQKMGEKTFAALKNCKAFLRYGIGYDTFDVDATTKYGKMICNMPTYCIDEVATHTVALALAASRAIYYEAKTLKEGIYPVEKLFRRHSMRFTTFGLLGFGNIAKKVAEFIKPYGGRVIVYDPYVEQEVVDKYGVEKVEWDEFLATADFISVHTPLNQHTFHLLDLCYGRYLLTKLMN